ncbi:hypothetical protein PM082_004049 [Marasmius tenuissimus]|nr:hypothetical protein PM082_004049 [Marasmius tenuissimus]
MAQQLKEYCTNTAHPNHWSNPLTVSDAVHSTQDGRGLRMAPASLISRWLIHVYATDGSDVTVVDQFVVHAPGDPTSA